MSDPGQAPAGGRCPRCAAPLRADQDWCLECGAPARTRLARAPNWRLPVLALAVVVLLCGGAVAFAFDRLATTNPDLATTTVAPTVTTAPATTPTVAPPPATNTAPATTTPPPAGVTRAPTVTTTAPRTGGAAAPTGKR